MILEFMTNNYKLAKVKGLFAASDRTVNEGIRIRLRYSLASTGLSVEDEVFV